MPEQPVFAPEALGPTITIGEILVEIMADTVGDGFGEPLALIGPYPSGAPAIFIDQVARMGAKAGMIGAVGRDDFGRLNLDRLRADGVDVSAIAQSDTHPTGTAFVRYRADGRRDFVFNITESAAGRIAPSPETDALISKAGHLHVMGSALSMPSAWPLAQQALKAVKARGGSVSFDPNIRKELLGAPGFQARFDEVLAATDCLLPSGDELLATAAASDEPSALAALLGVGITEIVLKRGAQGASHISKSARIEQPAFRVAEVDPTGAGDCFGGAYVAARRLGLTLDDALRYAAAAGARAVTRRGPMQGAAFRAALDAFIAEPPAES